MRRFRVVILVAAGLLAACRTHARKLEPFRTRYHQGDFAAADREINGLLASAAGVSPDEIARTGATGVDAGRGDTHLLLLEKAMTQLALDRPEIALRLLRAARDELDERYARDVKQYFASALADDRALSYRGADYEHILVRVMLCLCDLLVHSSATGGDAYAYALQVGEKQEEILASPLGEDAGYQPRQEYRRVGIGAYLQGILLEATGSMDGAARAYRRCVDYEPAFRIGREALERARAGRYAGPGEGVLHVFFLGGPGPFYVEGESPPTELALRIAQVVAVVLVDSPVPLAQTNVPVPVLVAPVRQIPPVAVAAGAVEARTETLLEVDRVCGQQLEAMMPFIIARAVIRRAVKTTITTVGAKAGRRKNRGRSGDWIELGMVLANLLWTAAERADTRVWTSLPAQFQVARLTLPEGRHMVSLGGGSGTEIRITAGRDSYVVLIRPHLARPGALLVDRLSRPDAGGVSGTVRKQ